MWSFDGDEVETIERVKLIRLGVRLDEIEQLDMFERMDLLEIGAVEQFVEADMQAKLTVQKWVEVKNRSMRRR